MYYSVPVDLRAVVYCTAIRQGGDREWKFLWTRYSKSNVGSERSMILGSLGCSREIWLLQRYLDWTLDESTGVRKQDRSIVFSTVAHNDNGFLLAKSFFFNKVDEIHQKYVCHKTGKNEICFTKFVSFISFCFPAYCRTQLELNVI